jgi:RND family efflux transporter MFP subunit
MKKQFALALVALSVVSCSKKAVEQIETTGPLTVQAEPAKLDEIQTLITVTGTVMPAPGADFTFSAPEAGKVVELPKGEGDVVKVGDVLARFEIPSLTSDLIASQSEVLQAGARLRNAQSAATRLTGLVQRGIAAQKDLDEAVREQGEAEAAVRQAEGHRQAAELMSSRTVVRARFAGVVAQRWHNPGDSVEAVATDPVLKVIDPARLEVEASVPAAQLGSITPGHPAKVFDPSDGSEIEARVLTRPPSVDSAAATGDVRISIIGATRAKLVAGTPIQVEITGDLRTNVLVVPAAAVFHEGDEVFVVVVGEDGKAHHKSVKTGIVTREKAQIVSGLTAGEKVIVGGEPVPDGAAITIGK